MWQNCSVFIVFRIVTICIVSSQIFTMSVLRTGCSSLSESELGIAEV